MKTKEGLQYELETVEIKPSPKEQVGQELIHKKKRVSVCERFCESRSGVSGGEGEREVKSYQERETGGSDCERTFNFKSVVRFP